MLLFGGLSSRKEQNSEIALSDIWIFDQNLVTSTIASDPSQRVLHFPKLWKQCGSDFSHKSWRDCPEVCKYTRSLFSWCWRTRRKECGTHVTTTNIMVISSLSAVRFDRALKKTRKFFHGIISSSRVSFWVLNCIQLYLHLSRATETDRPRRSSGHQYSFSRQQIHLPLVEGKILQPASKLRRAWT